MEGSSLLSGKSWPFHRSQDTSACIGSSVDTHASGFASSSLMGLKESKAFGGFAVRQAEWEKQMESMDQKQAELFHFQWNLIREQLGSLTTGMAAMRQDVEAFRSTEARREVREADFARVVREVQADLERESSSRRKDNEEILEAFAQLKQAADHERSDRMHSIQALEKEVSQQIKNIKMQQQQTLDADKDLSNRFEHWCMELRATLDKESGARGQKIEEVDRKVHRIEENLEKETRQRITSIDELTSMYKDNGMLRLSKLDDLERELQKLEQRLDKEIRDRGSSIDDTLNSVKVVSSDLEREVATRKKECEEILRSSNHWKQTTDKEMRDLRELARETSSELARGLQTEAEDRRRIDIRVSSLEIQLPSSMENERAERSASMEKLNKRLEDAIAKVIEDMDDRHHELRQSDLQMEHRQSDMKDRWEQLHSRHDDWLGRHEESLATLLGKHDELHGKHEELFQKVIFFNEKHEQAFTGLAGRTEEIHNLLHDALSRVGPDAEARAIAAVEAMFVAKLEFQQSVQRLWEALDSHTHDVDVAAMQQNQMQAVQVRTAVRRSPTPPPTVVRQVRAPSTCIGAPPTATVGIDRNHDGKADMYVTGVDMNGDGIPDCLQVPQAHRATSPVVMRRVSSGSQPASPVVTEFKSGSMTFDINSPSAIAFSSASVVGPPRTTGISIPTVQRRCSSPLASLHGRSTVPASITSVTTGPLELMSDMSIPRVGTTTLAGTGTLIRK